MYNAASGCSLARGAYCWSRFAFMEVGMADDEYCVNCGKPLVCDACNDNNAALLDEAREIIEDLHLMCRMEDNWFPKTKEGQRVQAWLKKAGG